MEPILVAGLSAGAITVILCTSTIMAWARCIPWISKVLQCPLCTSFWVSLAIDRSLTTFATMAIANFTVLLIHWSISTYKEE
jgi:hypothetical protein